MKKRKAFDYCRQPPICDAELVEVPTPLPELFLLRCFIFMKVVSRFHGRASSAEKFLGGGDPRLIDLAGDRNRFTRVQSGHIPHFNPAFVRTAARSVG